MRAIARLAKTDCELDRVEAACRAVAAPRALTIQLRSKAGSITCWFEIPGHDLRAWELRAGARARELDARWQAFGYRGTQRVNVEIVFDAPADASHATMLFDELRAANAVCPNVGKELLYALADVLGVACETKA